MTMQTHQPPQNDALGATPAGRQLRFSVITRAASISYEMPNGSFSELAMGAVLPVSTMGVTFDPATQRYTLWPHTRFRILLNGQLKMIVLFAGVGMPLTGNISGWFGIVDRDIPCPKRGWVHTATGEGCAPRYTPIFDIQPQPGYGEPAIAAAPDALAGESGPEQLGAMGQIWLMARNKLRFEYLQIGSGVSTSSPPVVVLAGLPIPPSLLQVQSDRGSYVLRTNLRLSRFNSTNGTWEVLHSFSSAPLSAYAAQAIAIIDKNRPCPGRHTGRLADGSCVELPQPPPGTSIIGDRPEIDMSANPDALARAPQQQLAASAPRRGVVTGNQNLRLIRLNKDRAPVYVVVAGDTIATILRKFGMMPDQAFNLIRFNPHKRVNRYRGVPEFRMLVPGERLMVPPNWLVPPSRPTRVSSLLDQLAAADLLKVQDGQAVRLWNLGKGGDHWHKRTPLLGKIITQLGLYPCPDGMYVTGYDDNYDPVCEPIPPDSTFGPGEGEQCTMPDGSPGTVINGVCVPYEAANTGQACYDADGNQGVINTKGICTAIEGCPDGSVPKNGDPNNGCAQPGTECDFGDGNPSGGMYTEDGYCVDLSKPLPGSGESNECGGVGCNQKTSTWNGTQCVLNDYGQGRENAAELRGAGWQYDACTDTYYNLPDGISGRADLPPCPDGYELKNGACVKKDTGQVQPQPQGCPTGQHKENGLCVPDGGGGAPPVTCPAGNHKDPATGLCVKDAPPDNQKTGGKAADKGWSTGAKFGVAAVVVALVVAIAKAAGGAKGGAKGKAPKKKTTTKRLPARR